MRRAGRTERTLTAGFVDRDDELAALKAGLDDVLEIDPQRGFSRCNVPGVSNPGAACTSDADCPGPGDPPTRTHCESGIPPPANTPPPFDNGAHFAVASDAIARQVDAFLRPTGDVRQFCSGPCDPD